MSRRHKTIEELERIQSRKRGSQGDCSRKVISFENTFKKQALLTEQIQQAIIGAIEAQKESEETDNIAKRGCRKVQQLLGKFKNSEVVSWFERIRAKFNKVVESLEELMVCFFCAVFDIIPSESRHGKAVGIRARTETLSQLEETARSPDGDPTFVASNHISYSIPEAELSEQRTA